MSQNFWLFQKLFDIFSIFGVRFKYFLVKNSNFNWPGLGGTARTDGTARTGPSPGQLKFEILKFWVESSENGPKAYQNRPKRSETIRKRSENRPKTVAKRSETIQSCPKPSENNPKLSETIRKRSENRPKPSETIRNRLDAFGIRSVRRPFC